MKTTTATAKHIKPQAHKVMRLPTGERILRFADGTTLHADIASLCAGADAWISAIVCKCRDCGQSFPLRELQGGGQWCEPCQTVGIDD